VGSRGACLYGSGVGRTASGGLQRRLAAGLRRERARKGITQERAAELAGLNARHYQKLEEGSVNVTLRTLDRLSLAFAVDVTRLLSPSSSGPTSRAK
jgi:transcriptional regulator with XRE-family HTH domain